jgi:hypothetical protein
MQNPVVKQDPRQHSDTSVFPKKSRFKFEGDIAGICLISSSAYLPSYIGTRSDSNSCEGHLGSTLMIAKN